jgi:hypothetical protein
VKLADLEEMAGHRQAHDPQADERYGMNAHRGSLRGGRVYFET